MYDILLEIEEQLAPPQGLKPGVVGTWRGRARNTSRCAPTGTRAVHPAPEGASQTSHCSSLPAKRQKFSHFIP